MRKILYTLLFVVIVGLAGGAVYVYSGVYDIAATSQHTSPIYRLLKLARDRSVAMRANGIDVPDLADPERVRDGLGHFMEHCVQCHGAPGVAPSRFALGMTPVPPSLAQSAKDRSSAEIFWIGKNGLKMTGMPGWDLKLSDEQIWNVVAFIETMPTISPVDFYQRAGIETPTEGAATDGANASSGDPRKGKVALRQYACVSCHTIPDVTGPDAWVGPPLRNFGERKYIAGVLRNDEQNLIRWIQNPQGIDPLTAMPDMGVDDDSARHMAAYLLSLE